MTIISCPKMKYESYYKNKVTFNDKTEEFDYINSYEDFIKKCCKIFIEKEENKFI